jgi:hypothetical protein
MKQSNKGASAQEEEKHKDRNTVIAAKGSSEHEK